VFTNVQSAPLVQSVWASALEHAKAKAANPALGRTLFTFIGLPIVVRLSCEGALL
jgi:hypothetical protein